MPMEANEIERRIKEALPDAQIDIRDLAGDGDHWAATVISEQFRGKSRVQQHQLVYAALQPDMRGALHALALQTSVPEQPMSLRYSRDRIRPVKPEAGHAALESEISHERASSLRAAEQKVIATLAAW